MDVPNHILVFLLTCVTSCCHGNECQTGCAPLWNFGEPTLGTVARLQGEDVDFRCRAFGTPRPLVTWSKDGKSLPSGSTFDGKMIVGRDSVQLVDLNPLDSGSYTCFVQNRFGSLQWSVYLTVYEPGSEEINGPKNKTAYVNQTAEFWCKVDVLDDADAIVIWVHDVMNATSFTENAQEVKVGVYKNYDQLVLPRVTIADSGRYTCLVNTSLTTVLRSAWLTVNNTPGEGPQTAGSTEDGVPVPTTPFVRYLQNVGITVAAISAAALGVALAVSGITIYRNWRRLKTENRGTKRLQDKKVVEQEL